VTYIIGNNTMVKTTLSSLRIAATLVTLGSDCFTTAVPLESNGLKVRFLFLFLNLLSIGSLLPPVSHARCFRGPVPFL